MALVVPRLRRRLPDVPVERLEQEVQAACAEYRDCRIRDFVPILVERDVLERVRRAPAAAPALVTVL